MPLAYFIAHPEVTIDPNLPVPEWNLSPTGRARLAAMLVQPWVVGLGAVFSSPERKAHTTAQVLAEINGLSVQILADLAEIDRTATGYLPQEEHDALARECFSRPGERVHGWESAFSAQQRVVQAVMLASNLAPPRQDFAISAHAGVGTLLINYLQVTEISISAAAPGQGYYFAFTPPAGPLWHTWWPIDSPAPGMKPTEE